jgi:hypothetical protein
MNDFTPFLPPNPLQTRSFGEKRDERIAKEIANDKEKMKNKYRLKKSDSNSIVILIIFLFTIITRFALTKIRNLCQRSGLRLWPIRVLGALALLNFGCSQSNQELDVRCENNARLIKLIAMGFIVDHDGRFPANLGEALQDEIDERRGETPPGAGIFLPDFLACPQDRKHPFHRLTSWRDVDFTESSYELLNLSTTTNEISYEQLEASVAVKCKLCGIRESETASKP